METIVWENQWKCPSSLQRLTLNSIFCYMNSSCFVLWKIALTISCKSFVQNNLTYVTYISLQLLHSVFSNHNKLVQITSSTMAARFSRRGECIGLDKRVIWSNHIEYINNVFISQLVLPPPQKVRSSLVGAQGYQRLPFSKHGVGQSIALYAAPDDRASTYLVSAFLIRSSSFSPSS